LTSSVAVGVFGTNPDQCLSLPWNFFANYRLPFYRLLVSLDLIRAELAKAFDAENGKNLRGVPGAIPALRAAISTC